MASSVNTAAAPQAVSSDHTQKIATPTRIVVASIIGGATALAIGGAATYYLGLPTVVSKVNDILKSCPSYFSYKAESRTISALGAAGATIVGGLLGGTVGKLTAHKVSLNDVKSQLKIPASDLNFSQIHRVADIAVNGGIFQNRSMTAVFKDDATRIRNLNRELTETEFSLSSNAHLTSKKRGVEDRFFNLEGAKLADASQKPDQFIASLKALKDSIDSEVKATDKYTYQNGNSSTAISRRDYILASIMSFAYDFGIAGSYLSAAVKDRARAAAAHPKVAEANFRKAIQEGIVSGILAPNVDSKSYEGLVDAGALASQLSEGRNPDAVISSIFDSFKETGLINGNLRARFIKDVHQKMSNSQAMIANPMLGNNQNPPSLRDRLLNNPQFSNPSELGLEQEEGLPDPDVPQNETKAEKKARLFREAEMKANGDVEQYADSLGKLDPHLKDLAGLYGKLIQLLNEKKVPLDRIMRMGVSALRGAHVLRHKDGFDSLEEYEANDEAIRLTREQIASLKEQIDIDKSTRPENFKFASRAMRKAAEALEHQIKVAEARINGLSKKAVAIDAQMNSIETTLGDNEETANTFLLKKEKSLPNPNLPKKPGFFERLFKAKRGAEPSTEDQLNGEVHVEGAEDGGAVATEEGLYGPVVDEPVVDEPGAQAEDDVLPEPIII